jgi:WD40 repeat protein
MRLSSKFSALVGITGLATLTLTSSAGLAQFSTGNFIGSVTSGVVAGAISEAIQQNIQEILNARPVIDMEKVSKVHDVGIAVNADRMVTALGDGTIRLWSLNEGRELARLEGHDGKATKVAISETAGLIVSLGEDGEAQVWRLDSGKRVARYRADSKALSVAFSSSGDVAVTGHEDGAVHIWSPSEGALQSSIATDGEPVGAVAVGGGDEIVVVGTSEGRIGAWNMNSGESAFTVSAHDGNILSVALSQDGQQIISGGEDGRVRITDASSGDELASIETGGDAIRSIAVNDVGDRVAVAGDDGVLRLFDTATGEETAAFEGHAAAITSVAFGKGEKVVHTASLDGTTRVFERDSGAELAQAISTTDGWAVYNMEGEFDGAGDALEAVAWTAEDTAFDLDRFAESHYEPGLLSRASEGEIVEKKEERPNLSVQFATPPVVAFATPDEDTESDSEMYEVTAQAGDLGGGIIELRLYQNGRLVRTKDLSDEDEKEVNADFEVKLLMGRNRFRLVALSRDRIESRPAKVTVNYTGEELKSDLHVVTIGINEYRNPALNLNYGVPDATGIREFFEAQPRKIFDEIMFYSLENRDATRSNIKEMLTSLTDTKPDDVVIIYYAGHGETVEKDWYLIPADLVYPEREDAIREKGIKSDELQKWVGDITANKVVMFMDACKSGAALKAFRGFGERKALAKLARSSGVHIVAAAAKDQFATELKTLGHGAFTYALLDGLKGQADYAKDSVINIRELMTYIENRLPDLSEEVAGRPQFPVISSRGGDFPLAVN